MINFYNMDVDEVTEMEEQEIPTGICVVQAGEDEYFESANELCQIIVGSGADATILPAAFLGVGAELNESAPRLQDAQGEHILRRMFASASRLSRARRSRSTRKGHFAEGINQPTLSFGKMMQAGRGISGEDQVLTYGGGPQQIRIPLKLQNKSLIAQGFVRAIQTAPCMVRVLEATLMKELEDTARAQSGWTRSGDRWIGVHLGRKLQTPQYHGAIDATVDWFRTTRSRSMATR